MIKDWACRQLFLQPALVWTTIFLKENITHMFVPHKVSSFLYLDAMKVHPLPYGYLLSIVPVHAYILLHIA